MQLVSQLPHGQIHARPIALKEFPATYFWTWIVLEALVTENMSVGWQEMVSIEDDLFFILCSQLGHVAVSTDAQNQVARYFVRSDDLEFAKQYPVMLAYQGLATMPLSVPSEILIGTHGVILNRDNISLYTLDQLKQEGKKTWENLQRDIAPELQPRKRSRGRKKAESGSVELPLEYDPFKAARATAQQLAMQYWQLNEKQSQEAETQSYHRSLPQIYNVLHNQGMIIPQLDPVEGVLYALSNAQREEGGWEEINKVPTYVHDRPTSTTEVTVRPHDNQQVQIIKGDLSKQLWQRVRQFNDVDGDIFLAMIAQHLGSPSEAQSGTWITTQQILEYRGIQPKTHKKESNNKGEVSYRRAGHRFEDMKEIADSINRIRDTHITVRTWKENHKKKQASKPTMRRRIFQQESYLINVTDFILQSHLLPDDEQSTEEPLAVAWLYQPGTCLETFFNGPNYQAAWLLQQALRYDPYHERWEKRLARYFTFQMRMNADFGGMTIRRTVGSLLDELALSINESDPKKTRARFEKAMQRLEDDCIISSWAEDQYQVDMEKLPRKNWLPLWLAYELEVSAAPLNHDQIEDVSEHLQIQRKRRRTIKLLSEASD